jgi:hypothetical protein
MTLHLIPLLVAVVGALLWWLAAPKAPRLSTAGMWLFIIGAAVVVLHSGGKSVRLGMIGDALIGTAHADPADDAPDDEQRAAPAEDTVSPMDDSEPDAQRIYAAVRSGQWVVAAGLVLLALVWAVRKYGGKLWPFLLTDRGGVVTSLALAFLGALGTTLAAGRTPGPADVMAALGLAFTASGGWTMVRRLINPKSTDPAPPPQG